MKRPLRIIIIILVIIGALPFVSMLRWTFQAKKPMNILVLNKSVPTPDRLSHRSFFWILNNERFVSKETNRNYSYSSDYYGFFPLKPLRDRQFRKVDYRLTEILDLAENNDALYFADTYGVFFSDWYPLTQSRTRRTRKIYGGLNNNDLLLMSEMQRREKLVILEYNTFDFPTADLERFKIEEMLGVRSTGWSGKYFSTLDTTVNREIEPWMTAMYRRFHNSPWTFRNAGVVLLKNREIVVLELGEHLTTEFPFIITSPDYTERFGVANRVPFVEWFDVIEPDNTEVISSFRLMTTPAGEELLLENFLVNTFPAVILNPEGINTWYFAGDFAKNDIPWLSSYFFNAPFFKRLAYRDNDENDPRRFFWLYYRPLVTTIFNDYRESH